MVKINNRMHMTRQGVIKNNPAKRTVSAKLERLFTGISNLNGGGYFTNDYETVKDGIYKCGGITEFMKDFDNSIEREDVGFQEELDDEHGDTSYIRALTKDKDRLDNAIYRFKRAFSSEFGIKWYWGE